MTKNRYLTSEYGNRVSLSVHPKVRERLAFLLTSDPHTAGTSIGYSEFIMDAIDAFLEGKWQPERSFDV